METWAYVVIGISTYYIYGKNNFEPATNLEVAEE